MGDKTHILIIKIKVKVPKVKLFLRVYRFLLSVGMELQRAALQGGFAGWIGVG